MEAIAQGFPDQKLKLDGGTHRYWKIREGLTVWEGVALYGNRVVVPYSMRREVLADLHAPHQGQERTLARAWQCIFWPDITNDVKQVVRRCDKCKENKASYGREPMIQDAPPKWPGEAIAADLCYLGGREYLVVVDKYSGWPEVYAFSKGATTESVTACLLQWSTQLGVARRLVTDRGPQFKSTESAAFCQKWGIRHDPSSPRNHQSNGHAEAAVKSMKAMIKKIKPRGDLSGEWFLHAMLEYRNMPRKDGLSPVQWLFGRPVRTKLPAGPACFEQSLQQTIKEADPRSEMLRMKAKARYDAGARVLKELQPGEVVRVQDPGSGLWDTLAEVIKRYPARRSYLIRTETGHLKWRNRRFLCQATAQDERESKDGVAEIPQPMRQSTRKKKMPDYYMS